MGNQEGSEQALDRDTRHIQELSDGSEEQSEEETSTIDLNQEVEGVPEIEPLVRLPNSSADHNMISAKQSGVPAFSSHDKAKKKQSSNEGSSYWI